MSERCTGSPRLSLSLIAVVRAGMRCRTRAITPAVLRPPWRSRSSYPLKVWLIDSMVWRSDLNSCSDQVRAFGGLARAAALDRGGVNDPHVVGPQRGVDGREPPQRSKARPRPYQVVRGDVERGRESVQVGVHRASTGSDVGSATSIMNALAPLRRSAVARNTGGGCEQAPEHPRTGAIVNGCGLTGCSAADCCPWMSSPAGSGGRRRLEACQPRRGARLRVRPPAPALSGRPA